MQCHPAIQKGPGVPGTQPIAVWLLAQLDAPAQASAIAQGRAGPQEGQGTGGGDTNTAGALEDRPDLALLGQIGQQARPALIREKAGGGGGVVLARCRDGFRFPHDWVRADIGKEQWTASRTWVCGQLTKTTDTIIGGVGRHRNQGLIGV